jgi:hypothetical protein
MYGIASLSSKLADVRGILANQSDKSLVSSMEL